MKELGASVPGYVLENGTAGTSYAMLCALRTLAMSDVRNKNSLRLLKSSAVARHSSKRPR